MIEVLQHVLGALTDNTIAFYKKILTALVVVFLVFAVNDLLSLSFNHRIDRRIAQLEALSKIIPTADTLATRRDVAAIAAQIRTHKPVLVQAEQLLISLANNQLSKDQRTFIMKLLSAASLFIITILVTPLIEKDPKERALMVGGLLVIGVPIVSLLMFIPTFAHPWINYVLNVFLTSALFVVLYFADDDKEEAA